MTTGRVTLSDVAAHAGVSRATASLVLRGTGRVAEDTRGRVRASMDALGYVYHRGAASLRSRQTESVGLIVSDITNGFTAELSVGLESALAEAGVVTLMANAFEDPARQDLLVRSMLERQVDGLIVIPAVATAPSFADQLKALPIPAVVTNRALPDDEILYAGIDNVRGGRLAAEHLGSHGVHSVGFLGGFDELGPRRDRVAGVAGYCDEEGTPTTLAVDISGPPRGAWGLAQARGLIARHELPEGIICHNDQVAFGVYRAIRESGDLTPRAVRVVSFDDVAEAALWEPPLTTIAANGYQLGARCAEVLLRHIHEPGQAVERSLILPSLVVRESCGCPPG